jgi:hypothetical protein
MSRYEEACPFEARTRANRCETCCSANSVPPCAAAYLSSATERPASNIIAITSLREVAFRKAA